MKKLYEELELEIIRFDAEDIICESGETGGGGGSSEGDGGDDLG